MKDLPVEKRVGVKKVWTIGAEGFVAFAGFGHGIRRNAKVRSFG